MLKYSDALQVALIVRERWDFVTDVIMCVICVPFWFQLLVEELKRMFDKYLEKLQQFKKENACKELVPICELNAVASLTRLFDCLATPANGVSLFASIYYGVKSF